jgi:hypothetical protein
LSNIFWCDCLRRLTNSSFFILPPFFYSESVFRFRTYCSANISKCQRIPYILFSFRIIFTFF